MRNLNDFIIFAHVVDHKGFAPAARVLNVPKSTLSKRVAELEKTLGVRLINRTSRRFTMTEIGEDFYRHAAAMLIEAEAAEAVVKGRLAEPSGTVRITASVPTAQMTLAGLLPQLALTYPKMRVVLHATDRFVDLIQEGFDIAVRDHFASLPDSGLVQRRVAADVIWLVAAPSYLARKGVPFGPDDLGGHDGLLSSLVSDGWTLRHQDGAAVSARPKPRFVADESHVLLEAALSGLGITALPHKLCRAEIENGSLVRVLPEWQAGLVTTTLLMPHRRGQLPSVRAVVDFIADRLAGG
ncbi:MULTISPECIES: LysR substrate-binding domain-containing protein [unclassified Ensifer]|uniref:LysR substrate-binding domain-containing protein n=1 Tax=unclassified Ensifer TaxID=2633371 RepID=UPI0008137BF6|nr:MULTISPECIES: LysR substrate-binding domain-containing protein [unclassified Ensifer]OCP09240.1 LysR family transcriptional regulator [Ensifer sp. LC13]OCP10426.1 LysR family transcriptional regulator [Ensifer sp. LC11]OCP13972.1 LysR family transcriptional regulator [Ensifer sp. LC14]OCP32488.1 LysR family transcriptional regulator [Ensifer sp. LC499]